MTIDDWSGLPAATLAPLYRREAIQWRRRLHWDPASSFATIEAARAGWGLPGFVCRDRRGDIRGWTYFLIQGRQLLVGGLTADTPEATAALVAGVLARARTVGTLGGYLWVSAPSLIGCLEREGVLGPRSRYLVRSLSHDGDDHRCAGVVPHEPGAPGCPCAAHRPADSWTNATWTEARREAAARLLRDAYGTAGRLFAPHGTLPEWHAYLTGLTTQPGCGTLLPALSQVVLEGDDLRGLALVTTLSRSTAHLAQLAVHPQLRRAGLGRRMVEEALTRARAAGFSRLSLLVAEDNAGAGGLYAKLGFLERGTFVELRNPQNWDPQV